MELSYFSSINIHEGCNYESVKVNSFTVRDLIKHLLDCDVDSEIETVNDRIIGVVQNSNKVQLNSVSKILETEVVRNYELVKVKSFIVRDLIKQLLDCNLDFEIEMTNDRIIGVVQNGNKVHFTTVSKILETEVVFNDDQVRLFFDSSQFLHPYLRNLILNTESNSGKSMIFDDTLGSCQNWKDLLD